LAKSFNFTLVQWESYAAQRTEDDAEPDLSFESESSSDSDEEEPKLSNAVMHTTTVGLSLLENFFIWL